MNVIRPAFGSSVDIVKFTDSEKEFLAAVLARGQQMGVLTSRLDITHDHLRPSDPLQEPDREGARFSEVTFLSEFHEDPFEALRIRKVQRPEDGGISVHISFMGLDEDGAPNHNIDSWEALDFAQAAEMVACILDHMQACKAGDFTLSGDLDRHSHPSSSGGNIAPLM